MKTADGVKITDGMAVFIPGPWMAHCERVDIVDGVAKSAYLGTVFAGGVVDPAICYSTSEAATEAWEKIGLPAPEDDGEQKCQ